MSSPSPSSSSSAGSSPAAPRTVRSVSERRRADERRVGSRGGRKESKGAAAVAVEVRVGDDDDSEEVDVSDSAISLEKLCLEEPFTLDDYICGGDSERARFYDADDAATHYQARTYDAHLQSLRQAELDFHSETDATVETTRKILLRMATAAGKAADAAREIGRLRQDALDHFGRGLLDGNGGETEEYRNHAVLPALWRDTIAAMCDVRKQDCAERAARLL